ncbi:hypothetical protein L3N51_01813 [Metallosphaera sp. J1]|uniref:hypothetical protein n=1 Tax=Metallosphaera javensis (ex Hofmann et al. 2022) TaxID=99938 RepID=UPI001EDFAB14|nr:hypothetical protein [Metallosphaera javensis (ex Hofmann et al. 2022)]MCG3109520.1 hypothetical protein [Metallosphaera javensis (ex Hofmann et al. 2022)]
MPSVVVTLLVVVVTLMLAIGVFGIYNSYFSTEGTAIAGNEIVVSQSKQTQIFVSPITFKGIGPSFTYFNVSFLLWYSAPVKNVVLVPFVVNPLPGLGTYLYSPQGEPNATILVNSTGTAKVLPYFTLSFPIFTPQGQQLQSGVPAYNASSTGTYIVHSIVKPGQIIVVWILTHEFGKWYRLGYFFVNPANAGLGLYVVTHTGVYLGNNRQLNVNPPLYLTNNKGIQMGFWFEPLGNATTNSTIFYTVITNITNGQSYYSRIYQSGLKIYIDTNSSGSPNVTYLGTVTPFEWYFLNISYGHQVNHGYLSDIITLYNSSKLIGKQSIEVGGETNGYAIQITFGSPDSIDAVSQAFLESLKNEKGVSAFYNVSSTVYHLGVSYPQYYNNTNNLYNIIKTDSSLYAIVYWYFVYPSSSPPSELSATVWYYYNPSKLYSTSISEAGPNTWIIG